MDYAHTLHIFITQFTQCKHRLFENKSNVLLPLTPTATPWNLPGMAVGTGYGLVVGVGNIHGAYV